MRIDEVTNKQLNEGPFDALKQAAAGIAGMVSGQGYTAAYQQKGADIMQQDADAKTKKLIDDTTKKALQNLAQWQSTMLAANQNKKITPADMVTWASKYFKTVIDQGPLNTTVNIVNKWVRSLVANAIANKAAPQAKQEIAKEAKPLVDSWQQYKQRLETVRPIDAKDFKVFAKQTLNFNGDKQLPLPNAVDDGTIQDWIIKYVAYHLATTGEPVRAGKVTTPTQQQTITQPDAVNVLKDLYSKLGKTLSDQEATNILAQYGTANP